MAYIAMNEAHLAEAAAVMKSTAEQLPSRIKALLDERKQLQNELANFRKQLAMAGSGQAEVSVQNINGTPFLAQKLSGVSGKDLRGMIDEHKKRLGKGIVLLIADTGERAAIAAGVTEGLGVSAVDIVRVAAEKLGGKGGGGRPDMAQAGGASAENADEAIEAVINMLEA